MFKKLGIVLCVVSLGVLSSLETQAAEPKAPEIKGGIPGKLVKVDVEKGTVTITREDGRERTFSVTKETTIVGPRGGIVHQRLRDHRFHSGLLLSVVAQGDEATEIHLGFDRKARTGAGLTGASTSGGTTESTETPQPTPAPTRRTSRFRGLVTPKSETPETAKTGDADEDNDFPGKIKRADTTRHLLVITLLNGKDRSFLLSRDVKFTHNGRSMRQGLADTLIKPGVPVTVVTEEGGRKVKEVKVTPAVSRRARTAG